MQLSDFSRFPRSDESLRKKAKQLLQHYRAGDETIAPLLEHLISQHGPIPEKPLTLQQVQFCLARAYGCHNWKSLLEKVKRNNEIEQECRHELRHFMNDSGLLVAWPAKQKKQKIFLLLLTTLFVPGYRYTEPQINEIVQSAHRFNDPALLRRLLFDYGFLERTRDCRCYWLKTEENIPSDIGPGR